MACSLSKSRLLGVTAILIGLIDVSIAFRVVQDAFGHDGEEPAAYFEPYHPGCVASLPVVVVADRPGRLSRRFSAVAPRFRFFDIVL